MSYESNGPVEFLSVEEASGIINKTSHSVRQLVSRGAIESEKRDNRLMLKIDSVMSYYARKKKLPAWGEMPSASRSKLFVNLGFASNTLKIQPAYIIRLIKEKKLEGYVTVDGEIMIARDSINTYLRRPEDNAPRTKNKNRP